MIQRPRGQHLHAGLGRADLRRALYSLHRWCAAWAPAATATTTRAAIPTRRWTPLVERVKVEVDQKRRAELIEQALILEHKDVSHLPLHNQVIPRAMKKNIEVVHRADNRPGLAPDQRQVGAAQAPPGGAPARRKACSVAWARTALRSPSKRQRCASVVRPRTSRTTRCPPACRRCHRSAAMPVTAATCARGAPSAMARTTGR